MDDKDKPRDVRNSVEKARRFTQVAKGKKDQAVPTRRRGNYYTWFRWGKERSELDDDCFKKEFECEWNRVLRNNMKKYGVPKPWNRLKSGRYVLEINK